MSFGFFTMYHLKIWTGRPPQTSDRLNFSQLIVWFFSNYQTFGANTFHERITFPKKKAISKNITGLESAELSDRKEEETQDWEWYVQPAQILLPASAPFPALPFDRHLSNLTQ